MFPPQPLSIRGRVDISAENDQQICQSKSDHKKATRQELRKQFNLKCGGLNVGRLGRSKSALPAYNGRWTTSFNGDQPSGSNNYKTFPPLRTESLSQIRNNPSAHDARLVRTHTRYTQTGQYPNIDLRPGSSCENHQHSYRRCLDCEARFCCPNDHIAAPACNGPWTRCCDRDQSSRNGNYETFPPLRNENLRQIYNNSTAHDARLVGTHTHYAQTGQTLNVDLRHGFSCENTQQSNRCMNCETRFCCSNDPVTSCNGRWANFCNRNQPRGNDAYKLSFPRLRNDNPNQIRNPTAFDARLVGTHARYAQTGQTLNADLRPGSSCGHVQQSNMRCMDHQVGFCCSNDALSTHNGRWTRLYNRDQPSGYGNYETFPELRNENPGHICNNSTALDARLVSTHTHVTQTGQTFNVNLNHGFNCVNASQSNGRCMDYGTRFCYP